MTSLEFINRDYFKNLIITCTRFLKYFLFTKDAVLFIRICISFVLKLNTCRL